ncbi:hypothetical protein HRI_000215000 [Hibiscus trionum]|uniref:Receptor-like serine/threonine-protein kinase n=1 Tax=Hibiscus trionum TaxID=183268 RepID=A0A9W7GUU0_HIBTR|nr:hypothetical protein HRI_000215000 [Hibiscus trionum]
MISATFHTQIFLITTILWILATVEAQGNVSVGDSLSANDKTMAWQSASGDFAFGFLPIPGENHQFLLAIWYAKIPQTTIVWYANRGHPEIDRESKVELAESGHLVLTDPAGKELWRSPRPTDDSRVSHAAMLDTGNFVIVSRNSSNIWESFKYPTDTILPEQELGVNDYLLSTSAETRYGKGKYQLRFSNGHFVLNQIDVFTGKPYEDYFEFGKGSRFVFNKSGHIQIPNQNGSLVEVAPINAVPKPDLNYYRATLDFYGVFTLYSYPRNPGGGESWSVVWFRPRNICRRFVGAEVTSGKATFGTGPCGYNSICEPINGRPNCTCPPGFSFLDDNNQYAGCKQNYANYPGDCNPDGSTIGEDRFGFKPMSFADFPLSDYGVLKPATELECRQSCLLDCSCAVAILQDPTLSKDGNGTCWKKKLPLSNGWFDRDALDRTALFKVLKSDASRENPARSSRSDENQNQIILILGVLLDLEHATNGFKKELGRGAFGTVYKGEFPSSNGDRVAVKKLDKFVRDGEREFKTEVKVIGQTHHKNLVRLIGYCDEAEHRLLVYEFMENGSLSSFLFGVLRPSWQQRLQIASGIAKGLTYLHEECSKQIIHCDIKPQNILLDESFTAKISDFGLAKLLLNNKTRTQTGIRGTKGYVAPEWFRNTPVSVKVDVYSFGVMLLEIICCRRCVEVEMEEAAILTEWAFQCYSEGMIGKLVENDEEARNDVGNLEMLLKVAIWCVQEEPILRPSMRIVTMMLEGAVHVPNPPCPFLLDTISMSATMI